VKTEIVDDFKYKDVFESQIETSIANKTS